MDFPRPVLGPAAARRLAGTFVLVIAFAGCGDHSPTATELAVYDSRTTTVTSSTESYGLYTLGGLNSSAIGLNTNGVVVGKSDRDGVQRAVYWTVDEAYTVSGPFELGDPQEVLHQAAMKVNDAGHVIVKGYGGFIADIATGEWVRLSLPEGADRVNPWNINSSDEVTGTANYGSEVRPVIWRTPFDPEVPPELLPLPDGYARLCSRSGIVVPLNDSGEIMAQLEAEDGTCAWARWTSLADGTIDGPHMIGATGFWGRQMNDAGQMPGTVGEYPSLDPVILEPDGGLTPLDPLSGDPRAAATAINDPVDGLPVQVAGISDIFGSDERAVVWTRESDGSYSDPVELPRRPEDEASRAGMMNADGWFVGQVGTFDGGSSDGATAALWIPGAEGGGIQDGGGGTGDGGTDDPGDECVPRGKHGRNCR